jgi:thiol-disulfide isomerase/thioredoxin
MKRTFFPHVAAAILVVAATAAFAPQQPDYKLVPDGTVAPNFTAHTPDGKAVKLSDYKGKVVILDFWATWCGPCMVSMPGLEKVYQQVKNKDVVVLSLNTWDDKDDFKAWVKENGGTKYHFNFVRDPAEGDREGIRKASIAKRLYSVPGIPTMYVIDKQGKIAGSFVGSGNEAKLVEVLGKVGVKATVPKE